MIEDVSLRAAPNQTFKSNDNLTFKSPRKDFHSLSRIKNEQEEEKEENIEDPEYRTQFREE